jgi:uncharacterized lipoprotein YddW (UPF0748 family)
MRILPLVFMTFVALAGCRAPEQSVSRMPAEVRGVWITNVDSEVLFSEEALIEGMQRLADHGFNTVFPVVWNKGYTLYPSETMVRYFGEEYRIDPLFAEQGRDPLAEIIREARRHGMTVIPWFEYGFAAEHAGFGEHILNRYPEWTAYDAAGERLTKNGFTWMNAFHPDVQAFMLSLLEEVARGYEVDGIQGDDRLPALPSEGGYDDFTVGLYRADFGEDPPADHQDPQWLQWRADLLSDFGGLIYQRIKAIRPDLIVSMSPSPFPWSVEEYLQDWPEWIRRGQVEMLHPQLYRYEIERYLSVLDESVEIFRSTEGHEAVQFTPGILIKVGPRFNGPEYVLEAVRANRRHGLPGEVYFFYEGLWEQNDSLAAVLYREIYGRP